MIVNEIQAPSRVYDKIDKDGRRIASIFTAGSIEMGKVVDWQAKLINNLSNGDNSFDILKANPTRRADGSVIVLNVFNPRRSNWDSSWKQEFNNSNFNEQVTWELDMLDKADVVPLYFAKDTQSPISLLELGLYAAYPGKLIVFCDETFWRRGNVEIVCSRFGIPFFTNEEAWTTRVKNKIIELS